MNDFRDEFLSQVAPVNSHIDYQKWLESKLAKARKELADLEDAIYDRTRVHIKKFRDDAYNRQGEIDKLFAQAEKNSEARR